MVDDGEQRDLDAGEWIHRREFLVRTGLLLGAATVAACEPLEPPQAMLLTGSPFPEQRQLSGTPIVRPAPASIAASPGPGATVASATPAARPPIASPSQQPAAAATGPVAPALPSWESVREQFNLAPGLIHMASFFLASHPRPVRDAIDAHRRGLDDNPIEYYGANHGRCEAAVLKAAGTYLGVSPTDIALTDSTTMGLGLLYGGLKLDAGQEILTTVHDHYATTGALQLRAQRTGSPLRSIRLYDDAARASQTEIVERLVAAVRPQTRVVAVTWVHSSTGVKLPISELAQALARINVNRPESERALLCVDGVHGLGIEDVRMADLGCDFFVAGCHKWLFGPRGTGLVWGKPAAWPAATATIPSFDGEAYGRWMRDLPPAELADGATMTPGGFHAFEHRWALAQAFEFHLAIGKARIAERIHSLNRRLKEGLAQLRRVQLHTPLADELSAGIVCFEVDGLAPAEVVPRLRERGIVASITPYATRYVRLAPSLLTSPEEVDHTLRAVQAVAGD